MSTVLILSGPGPAKTHAIDCTWVRGCQRWADDTGYAKRRYVTVPASMIAKDVGRCRHCGGGRR